MEILMNIAGIALDPLTNMPVVILLDEKGDRKLLVWIGMLEAVSIGTELAGMKPSRPLAHDLAKSMLEELGATVTKVAICDAKDSTYYAVTDLVDKDGKVFHKDSRPSDAIGLALRFKCPIYAEEKLLSNVNKDLATEDSLNAGESEETDLAKMDPEKMHKA